MNERRMGKNVILYRLFTIATQCNRYILRGSEKGVELIDVFKASDAWMTSVGVQRICIVSAVFCYIFIRNSRSDKKG